MAEAKKKSAGPRPKHVPVRMCIACRRSDAKRGLIRLVRDAEGHVAIDTTGKRAGRGAYLCHDPVCWEGALKRHGLERALRLEALQPEDRATLEQFARAIIAEAAGTPANTNDI